MSRLHPFTSHQHQVAKWQPSARFFGRSLWRGLVRHAVALDTEERRGRQPVAATIPTPFFGPESYGGGMGLLIRRTRMLDEMTPGSWQRLTNDVLWACRRPT